MSDSVRLSKCMGTCSTIINAMNRGAWPYRCTINGIVQVHVLTGSLYQGFSILLAWGHWAAWLNQFYKMGPDSVCILLHLTVVKIFEVKSSWYIFIIYTFYIIILHIFPQKSHMYYNFFRLRRLSSNPIFSIRNPRWLWRQKRDWVNIYRLL